MNIRELKIFVDIAQEKNFVKAAYRNYLTQPSISGYLKRLEEELGIKLFERVPRRVTLTKEGELLLPHVEALLQQHENLKTLAASLKKIKKGSIRLATIHSVGIYELTPFLKKFMRAYPEFQIHLEYRPAQIIYNLVLKKEIDFGLVAYPESHKNIQINYFGRDTMVLIVPPNHRLAGKQSAPLESIRGEKFIAFDPASPTRQAVDKVLTQHGILVSIRTINENIDTLKRAVEVGLGVSIVPSKTVLEEIQKGTLKSLRIRDMVIERPLGILTLKDRPLNQSAQLFVDMLKANSNNTKPYPS